MRIPRMSTRRWMIAVAVFALAMPVTRLESERSRKLSAEAERAGQRYYQSRKKNTAANFYRARSQKYARAASPLRFLMLWKSD